MPVSAEDLRDIFGRFASHSPYAWNAFTILGLEPHNLSLGAIVTSAHYREIETASRPEAVVVDGESIDDVAIRHAREQLEDPNTRMLQQLTYHRPHRNFRLACRKIVTQEQRGKLVQFALNAVEPPELLAVQESTSALQLELEQAEQGETRDALLAIIEHAKRLRTEQDKCRYTLRKLPAHAAPPFHAMVQWLNCQALVGLARWTDAASCCQQFAILASSPAERTAVQQMQLAIRVGRGSEPLHPTLRLAIGFARDDELDRAVSVLAAFLGRSPDDAGAHFLYGACCLGCLDVAQGLASLRSAVESAGQTPTRCVGGEVIVREMKRLVGYVLREDWVD